MARENDVETVERRVRDTSHEVALAGACAVVIPAFQEALTIGAIVAACRAVPEAGTVFVVDDGSRDGTGALAAARGAEVLTNASNVGKGASLVRGMEAALGSGAEWVATLDGDGQHRPEDLVLLLACAAANPQRIVIGSRRAGGARPARPDLTGAGTPRARFIANRVADFFVSWASGYPVDDSQSGFRVYPRAVLERLRAGAGLSGRFAFESEMLIEAGRIGVATIAVPIPSLYGATLRRASHFRPVTDIARIGGMMTGRLLRSGMKPMGLWRWVRR